MSDIKSQRLGKTLGSVSAMTLEATRQHVREELGRELEIPVVVDESQLQSEEDKRLKRLDIITDVQLVLVEKYRRAATLMWVAISLLVICAFTLVILGLIIADVQERIVHLAGEQRAMVTEQLAAKKAAQEAQKQAVATQKEVEATKQKVDEAVEASPKIEIDARGKAKVVVPVKKTESKDSKSVPKPPPAPTAQLPQQLPLELR